MKMLNAIIFWWYARRAWCEVFNTEVWVYEENTITGERRAWQIRDKFEPVNWRWLNAGKGKGQAFDI